MPTKYRATTNAKRISCRRGMARAYYYNVDNILTYARSIGKHDFSAMAGQTVEEYSYYSIGSSGASIINPAEKNWYLSQVTEDFRTSSDSVSPQPPLLVDRPSALQLRPALSGYRDLPRRRIQQIPRKSLGLTSLFRPCMAHQSGSIPARLHSADKPQTPLRLGQGRQRQHRQRCLHSEHVQQRPDIRRLCAGSQSAACQRCYSADMG